MAQTLTVREAREAARAFIAIVKQGRQWSLKTAIACLPKGWTLVDAWETDFYPMTIENATTTFRAHARREDK
jgi:uncharacterized protein YbdZ (MbtH family)